eukprot:TRINITY_DN9236_c0_g1_i4.p1 TRINITY_DN9236_c0_g1~~TRINITY_DN9236_c0_g1_i4.p1  ORF type:complete len:336 (+),score=50.86 TRINITY_DN9236_c0_g1_i4:90-1097(+)
MVDLSSDQIAQLRITYYIACSFSLVGSASVIAHLSSQRRKMVLSMRLVMCLAVCDFFTACAGLIGLFALDSVDQDSAEMGDLLCKVQGFSINFFNLCSAFWSVCIAYTVYRITVKLDRKINRMEKYYHIFSWGFPLVCMAVVLGTDQFGPQALWCWVKENDYHFKYYFLYLPVGIALSACIALYILVGVHVNREIEVDEAFHSPCLHGYRKLEKRITKMTIQLSLVFFFCWCWTYANRMYHDIHPDKIFMPLQFLNFFFTPLEGFCNAVIYGRIRRKALDENTASNEGVSHPSAPTESTYSSIFNSDPDRGFAMQKEPLLHSPSMGELKEGYANI